MLGPKLVSIPHSGTAHTKHCTKLDRQVGCLIVVMAYRWIPHIVGGLGLGLGEEPGLAGCLLRDCLSAPFVY